MYATYGAIQTGYIALLLAFGAVALAATLAPALLAAHRHRAWVRRQTRFAADHTGRTRLNDPTHDRGQRR